VRVFRFLVVFWGTRASSVRKRVVEYVKVDYLILGSYRPITLENTLSKILEKVIADHIVDTAKKYTLLL
jgi:hypothetical protein